MSKMKGVALVGIDVSAWWFDVCLEPPGRVARSFRFSNDPDGHLQFLRKLQELAPLGARVCLEATGVYSLDLSVLLDRTEGIEVMVLNPRRLPKFRDSLDVRNKTDMGDAQVALEFVRRMDFQGWQAPEARRLELREVARRIADLVAQRTQEKNRLHASMSAQALPRYVREDIAGNIEALTERIERLRRSAQSLIGEDSELARCHELMLTIPGIGKKSVIQIMGELMILPGGMLVRQWVAWSGLDPSRFESGTSVQKKPVISRKGSRPLRAALFLPAMSAARCNANVGAFVAALKARGKKPMQICVAVMRKLIHAIYGMLRTNTPWEGEKFRVIPVPGG